MGFGNVRVRFFEKQQPQENVHADMVYLQQQQIGTIYIGLHSSTLVYICLDSSTLICNYLHTRLHLSSDSSILIYIRLDSSVTHLHSSKLVYSHLVTRLCFQNRSKTFKYDCCLRVSLKILFEPKETQNQTLHKSLCPEETGLPRCSPEWVFLETLQYSEEHTCLQIY